MNLVRRSALAALVLCMSTTPAVAQDRAALEAGLRVERLDASPAELFLEVGETTGVEIRALDAAGEPVENVALRYAAPRSALRAFGGRVQARAPGSYEIVVTVLQPGDAERTPATLRIPVTISWPAITRVRIERQPAQLYADTRLDLTASAYHDDGTRRPGARFTWSSSDPDVASVDRFGTVTGHRPGRVTIAAAIEGATGSVSYQVEPFPAERLEITGGADQARTGDVLTFRGSATDAGGRAVEGVPVRWAFDYLPDDTIKGQGAAAEIEAGKFVAEEPGVYTVIAMVGPLSATRKVEITPRDAVRELEFVGQGNVNHVHTSDLWVFEGVDGRDYAVTGTWGGDGWAYFWDVTDPASIVKTDSLQVDARTVNDVKVSPDGRYAALSREGASNRRNGVVILDLSDPAHPEIASVYDDGLTGGVHNMFATEDHLFALSAGDKYVILDVTDLRNPTYVSEYNHPNSRVHDVWVQDGIAYSSEWGSGVVVVDVGNGRWGGSIESPVFVTNIPVPTEATHAAFPYLQEETGRFYLFLGDEIMHRQGRAWAGPGLARIPQQGGTPSVTQGYVHIIDFTDPENPAYVARYQADEFGTHNMWVEDDVLYQAYYEGGMRMVDVSGELMGDLKEQGREIAVFKPFDPDGYAANAPMVWGGFTHKGHVFFSDFNSGLWAVKMEPPAEEPTT